MTKWNNFSVKENISNLNNPMPSRKEEENWRGDVKILFLNFSTRGMKITFGTYFLDRCSIYVTLFMNYGTYSLLCQT